MARHTSTILSPAGLLLAALIGSTAGAATITVNTLDDTSSSACALRQAIANTNADSDSSSGGVCSAGSGADTIVFSVSGTISCWVAPCPPSPMPMD